MPNITLNLLSAISSILVGLFTIYVVQSYFFRKEKKRESHERSYNEQLALLNRSLDEVSAEVKRILREMDVILHDRHSAVNELENKIKDLIGHEELLKKKISDLERVPLPAYEHFLNRMEEGEKRSAERDYFLFILGVLLTTMIAIVLKRFFGV